jgi:hypothetical protein
MDHKKCDECMESAMVMADKVISKQKLMGQTRGIPGSVEDRNKLGGSCSAMLLGSLINVMFTEKLLKRKSWEDGTAVLGTSYGSKSLFKFWV